MAAGEKWLPDGFVGQWEDQRYPSEKNLHHYTKKGLQSVNVLVKEVGGWGLIWMRKKKKRSESLTVHLTSFRRGREPVSARGERSSSNTRKEDYERGRMGSLVLLSVNGGLQKRRSHQRGDEAKSSTGRKGKNCEDKELFSGLVK